MDMKRRWIGVVDDDPRICLSLERLLRSYEFAVHTYTSAASFLASNYLEDLACLILDVHMPELSGLELRDRLRAAGRHFPIIFITGHVDAKMRERATRGGAEAIARKTFLMIGVLMDLTPQGSKPSARLGIGEALRPVGRQDLFLKLRRLDAVHRQHLLPVPAAPACEGWLALF